MGTPCLWGLLVLLCLQAAMTSRVFGRSYSASDLDQLENLLERFEQTLVAVAPAEDSAADYEGPEPEHSPEGQLSPPLDPQEPEGGQSRTQRPRSWLQDLLLATRSMKTSGCFGGRLDRIGSASNLGCNPTKG